jgi:N-acetylmuramoyl-L-alanine amidase
MSLRVGAALAAGLLVATSACATPEADAAPTSIAGMIVFLDPGHNGANDASLTKQVPTGRGGTKDCQTSGTSTNDGYTEHTFNWMTVLRIRQELTALGVRTAMSRGNDNAVAPCVDERAEMANALHPDAIVSIHADGGPATGRGFHVNYSAPPLSQVQAGPVRPHHARPAAELRPRTRHLHRPGRALRTRRPHGAQSGPVPVDPRRDGQHEERRRRGADGKR